MIIDIPRQNKYRQGNDGELLGTLSRTFNVDMEQDKGKITLSRRMGIGTDVSDEAGLTVPTSFAYWEGRYWAVAGGTVYKSDTQSNGNPSTSMSPDTSTATPTGLLGDDELIVFNNVLYFIGSSIYKKDSSSHSADWTLVTAIGGGNIFRTASVYANRLYFKELGDKVESIDTSDVLATTTYTLELKARLVISGIRAASDGLWIATTNTVGGRAKVYKWDGVTENTPDASYTIPDTSVKSIIVFNDRPYIITGRGLIMTFNGSYFEEVDRFPFYYDIKDDFNDATKTDTWTHINATSVIDNKIHINIANPPIDDPINDNNRSYAGVWVLDPDAGLYHKYAFNGSDIDSDNINMQVDASSAGAIYPAAYEDTSPQWDDIGKFICGQQIYTDATTTTAIITYVMSKYAYDNSGATYPVELGWLVTSQIQATEVEESWQDLIVTFKHLTNSTDKIVAKARTNEDAYIDSTITWTSTTTFTSTDTDWATISTNLTAGTDYEVTILRGKGGGMCSHISSITEAGGTYTVTVDETHTGATSGTAKARIEKWSKLGEITDASSILNFKRMAVGGEDSTWIQYKLFLLGKGTSPTVERIISTSQASKRFQ